MFTTKKSLICGLLVLMSGHLALAQDTPKNIAFFVTPTQAPIGGEIGTKLGKNYLHFDSFGQYRLVSNPGTDKEISLTYTYSGRDDLTVCTYSNTPQEDLVCDKHSHLDTTPTTTIKLYINTLPKIIAIRSSKDPDTCKNMIQGIEIPNPCLVIGPDNQRRDVFVDIQSLTNDASSGTVKLQGLSRTVELSRDRQTRLISLPKLDDDEDILRLTLQNLTPKSDICILESLSSKRSEISCLNSLHSSKELELYLVNHGTGSDPYRYRQLIIKASTQQPDKTDCLESQFNRCILASYVRVSADGMPPPEPDLQ